MALDPTRVVVWPPVAIRGARSVLMLVVALLVGCSGADGADDSVTVRDSAGIQIVESARPRWREGDAWRVDSTPSLSIGSALEGDPATQFTRISSVARLADGRIAIVDDQTAELRIFDASGRHLVTAAGKGGGPGEYEPPLRLMKLPGDTLFLNGGFMSPRLGLHAPDGRFIRTLELPPVGPRRGRSTLTHRFADGTSLVSLGGVRIVDERAGAWTDSIEYYRVPPGADSAILLGRFPAHRWSGRGGGVTIVGYSPSLYFARHGNRLFVGFPDAFEFSVWESNGRQIRIVRRAWTPVPVDDAARAAFLRRYDDAAPPFRERYVASQTYADHHPAYVSLLADADGNVWARAPRLDAATFESDEPPPAPSTWSVFDTSGAWLGDVVLPAGLAPQEIGSDYVLGTWRDPELGVWYARMHRLVKP